LYEAATGGPAFRGETSAALFNSILNKAPAPPSRANPELPAELERIINKALEKDRDVRYQSAAEMRADLKRLKRDTSSGHSTVAIAAASATEGSAIRSSAKLPLASKSIWKKWGIAGAGVLVAVAILLYLQCRPSPPPQVSGYVPITTDGNAKGLVGTDGARLFLSELPPSRNAISQVSVTGGEIARISAPKAIMSLLSVSPDGSNLLVADELGQTSFRGALWSIPALGGAARKLGDAFGESGAWSPDGQSLAYSDFADLFVAKSDGSEPHKLFSAQDPKNRLNDVAWSPDGSQIRFTCAFNNWSKDSNYVYFLHEEDQPSVMRVRIRDHKLERVADLKSFRRTGYLGLWLGLAPDDSPLLLRDTGAQDIYALDWKAQ